MSGSHRNSDGLGSCRIEVGVAATEREAVIIAERHKRQRKLARRDEWERKQVERARAKITLPSLRCLEE